MVKRRIAKFSQLLLERSAWFVALFQALLIFCSLVVAWLLRFDFSLPDRVLLISAAPILVLTRLAAIRCFNLHHGWWRYAGINEALDIIKAVALGSAAFVLVIRYLLGVTVFPRSIYFIEALLTAALLGGVRLFSRTLVESVRENLTSSKKVIVIGAGFAAELILRELKHPGSGYTPVACVDDDRCKLGVRIHGVPVVGTVDQLPSLVPSYPVDEVLIAVPSATGPQMRRFVGICERTGVRFKTVPSLREIIAGRVSISQLREVDLEDLLGREPVQIDLESVRKQIDGRIVVVTGAAGSIGSELCRQILDYAPHKLVCVDQSETGMFYLRRELSAHKNGAQLVFCVADVRDWERMSRMFAEYKPQLVFHAAAYKHVPIMEWNAHEAVSNNVLALLDLLDVAEQAGCESFVLISSDKAVNPTSVMGATKRVCELILSARPANQMRCVSVRFGNVLGSSGSVIPVLREQLQNNQPLTVTHPDIKRFFMTTREAVALVLQAFAIGNHGDILVLDMGEPVRILDLAKSLIRLSGKSEEDVTIKITGLREGEKLQEELFYASEEVQATACEKIKRVHTISNGWPQLKQQLEELRTVMMVDGAEPLRAKLKQVVPEYDSQNGRPEPVEVSTHAPRAAAQKAGGMD